MIGLNFTIENINTVMQVYDEIEIIKYIGTAEIPANPTGTFPVEDWVALSGTVDYPIPVILVSNQSLYITYDMDGEDTDWYSSRYNESTVSGSYSGWSTPMLGQVGDLYYNPEFPNEIDYSAEDQRIIDRIRIYIGDPLDLHREYGPNALSSIHPDGKTYELDETGWPAFVTLGGISFVDTSNPSVNGYKFLKFQEFIDDICSTCVSDTNACGEYFNKSVENGIDIWYYTFRHSDRQIMEAYDTCPFPIGLTSATATSQAYMFQTAIDLITKELLEDSVEDGARIKDEGTTYDPSPGLKVRQDLLDDLRKKLTDLINTIKMQGITGVLID